MADVLPVHKVGGLKNGCTRRVVHCRCGVIEFVSDPEDIQIRQVLPEDGLVECGATDGNGQKAQEGKTSHSKKRVKDFVMFSVQETTIRCRLAGGKMTIPTYRKTTLSLP